MTMQYEWDPRNLTLTMTPFPQTQLPDWYPGGLLFLTGSSVAESCSTWNNPGSSLKVLPPPSLLPNLSLGQLTDNIRINLSYQSEQLWAVRKLWQVITKWPWQYRAWVVQAMNMYIGILVTARHSRDHFVYEPSINNHYRIFKKWAENIFLRLDLII